MFSIFINPLLKKLARILPNSVFAYADDVKLVVGVTEADYATTKAAILELFTWAIDNCMPLSTEKCFVIHFGNRNPRHNYSLGDVSMPITTVFKDLRVIRSEGKIYGTHIIQLAASCRRTCGMI
jgi:hypothetical protein